MGCKYLYLDEYGNPSELYEEALHKYGEKEAERIYIEHMIGDANIRFELGEPRKAMTLDELKKLKGRATDRGYEVLGSSRLYIRVTRWLNSLPKAAAEKVARAD